VRTFFCRSRTRYLFAFSAAGSGNRRNHEQAEGLIIDSDAVTGQVQAPMAAFARAHRLPLISAFRRVVEAGGLMSYGPNLHELWRQAARYIDKNPEGCQTR